MARGFLISAALGAALAVGATSGARAGEALAAQPPAGASINPAETPTPTASENIDWRGGVPDSGELRFKVLRAGSEIGEHRLTFEEKNGELVVKTDIDLAVKIAFITAFRFEHDNREVWKDGRLVRLDTETDHDGQPHAVKVEATDEGMMIDGSEFAGIGPQDLIPTSYWNPATITRTSLLNTQDGKIIDVQITNMGRETVVAEGHEIDATRYRMSGDLEVDLWYDDDNRWVKTRFIARGEPVETVLVEPIGKRVRTAARLQNSIN